MPDESFDKIWETLTRTGIAERLAARTTITPRAWRNTPVRGPREEDITLPAPVGREVAPDVARLPRLTVGARDESAELQIVEPLGRGGMGDVHLANQVSLDRQVAVKLLRNPDDDQQVEALLREARISGALEHPNVVTVHALGRDDRGPVLVMKRIVGMRWSTLLPKADDEDRLATSVLDRHLGILEEVCHALEYAHANDVIHRDIKPENVMVGAYSEVTLVDWGIAERIGEGGDGQPLGTPAYMAPEMLRGEAAAVCTDVYLLGATLHRVLTGTPRHGTGHVAAILKRAWLSEPVSYAPEIPAELAAICNKATAREPEDRFESVKAFREALADWRSHRDSIQLANASRARLEALDELIGPESDVLRGVRPGVPPKLDHEDTRRINDLGASCRFGFQQALEAWPENSSARDGLRRCLELLVPWELAVDEALEAGRLIDELKEIHPDPGTLSALDERVDGAIRRHKALEKLGRELDMRVHSGWRVAFLSVMSVVALVVGALVLIAVRYGFAPSDPRTFLGVAIFAAVTMSVSMGLFRRWVMNNLANRRVMYSVLLTCWGVVLHRLCAWQLGTPTEDAFVQDLIILSVASALAGAGVSRRVFVVAIYLALLASIAALFPAWALELLTVGVVGAICLLTVLFSGWIRR